MIRYTSGPQLRVYKINDRTNSPVTLKFIMFGLEFKAYIYIISWKTNTVLICLVMCPDDQSLYRVEEEDYSLFSGNQPVPTSLTNMVMDDYCE